MSAPGDAFEPWQLLEALLFASDAPIESERIQEVLGLESAADARAVVDELRGRLDAAGRALQVVDAGGGFRLVTRPEAAPWLVRLQKSRTRARLSRPALETLAIVAYHQPVSKPEVDAIRGVNSEGVLESLLERRLVRLAGRKDAPGRPFLYETTREFLIAFGLRDLADLPKVEGELVLPELPAGADGAPGAADAAPAGDAAAAQESAPAAGDAARATAGASGAAASADAPDALARDGAAPDIPEPTPAGDPPQQDPVPGGPDVAPRR